MKLGIIGCGTMASAMLGQMMSKGYVAPDEVIASAYHESSRERIAREFGIAVTEENTEVARQADILLIGIKPQDYKDVISAIRDDIDYRTLVITLAVGKSLAFIEECFGKSVKLVRAIPNTPALVGEGVTGYCANSWVTPEEKARAVELLETFGEAIEIQEKDMEVVGAIGGAGPAFVYIMIEALADGAVAEGLKRDLAYRFASQMVLGSGKMVRDSGRHPGNLKDLVCSPGGTTIEGISLLEERGFRSALIQAVRSCVDKSHVLAEK